MVTFIDKSGEGQSLSSSPIDSLTRVDSFVTSLENLLDLWVEVTIGRQNSDLIADLAQDLKVNASILHFTVAFRVLDFFPLDISPILSVELEILGLLIGSFQFILCLLVDLVKGRFRDALVDELLTIDVSHWVHVLNNSVHQWLGECGLIKLVMSHLTVTDEIDDHILTEFLTILSGNTESVSNIVH